MATQLNIDLTPLAMDTLPDNVPPELVRDLDWARGYCPVDFDEPYRETERLLAPGVPPILWSPNAVRAHPGKGSWIVTRYEDIAKVYQDAETFSTEGAAAYQWLAGETWPSIPLGIDPPDHMKYRMMLNPHFSPKAMDALEPKIRANARELIDECLAKGRCDASYDFARVLPVRVFLDLMGFPHAMLDQFLDWEAAILHGDKIEDKIVALRGILAYLRGFIAERRANPGTELGSKIVNGEVGGRSITDDEVMGTMFFLWLGGLDTVAATLAMIFRRLALDHLMQQELRDDPSKIPDAIEEFLRMQPLVNSQRLVKKDVEFGGVTFKKGDWVICLTAVGNFDPQEFGCPRQAQLDRQPNRHFTLAGGPHRCLGSHLARRELRVSLEEWLAHIPPFSLASEADRQVHPGLLSVRHLNIVW
jgi:cytochrome P450